MPAYCVQGQRTGGVAKRGNRAHGENARDAQFFFVDNEPAADGKNDLRRKVNGGAFEGHEHEDEQPLESDIRVTQWVIGAGYTRTADRGS